MTMPRSRRAALPGAALLAVAAAASAQIPDTFTNLEVLPKDVTKIELVRTMRNMTGELGVRCTHCHVGPDDLEGMDFAIDTKPAKKAAREMLKMVQSINAAVKALPDRDEPRDGVTCYTCHRRQPLPPRPMQDELVRAWQTGGGSAAVARYRQLRQTHLTDGTYDFGPLPLARTARRLLEKAPPDDALAVGREALSQFPADANTHALVGDILLRKGDKVAAMQSYRKALALEPDNFAATRGLKEAQGSQGASPSPPSR